MKNVVFLFLAISITSSLMFYSACAKPDPTDSIIVHTKTMLKIIRDNQDDCEKLVKELAAYTENHKQEFKKLRKQAEEMETAMSIGDKKQYQVNTMKKLSDIMQESMSAIMEISNKCPEKAAQVGTLMSLENLNSNE